MNTIKLLIINDKRSLTKKIFQYKTDEGLEKGFYEYIKNNGGDHKMANAALGHYKMPNGDTVCAVMSLKAVRLR